MFAHPTLLTGRTILHVVLAQAWPHRGTRCAILLGAGRLLSACTKCHAIVQDTYFSPRIACVYGSEPYVCPFIKCPHVPARGGCPCNTVALLCLHAGWLCEVLHDVALRRHTQGVLGFVQARSYRARAVRDPRSVLKEFGTTVPEGVAIQICDSNADTRSAPHSCQSCHSASCTPACTATADRRNPPRGSMRRMAPGLPRPALMPFSDFTTAYEGRGG